METDLTYNLQRIESIILIVLAGQENAHSPASRLYDIFDTEYIFFQLNNYYIFWSDAETNNITNFGRTTAHWEYYYCVGVCQTRPSISTVIRDWLHIVGRSATIDSTYHQATTSQSSFNRQACRRSCCLTLKCLLEGVQFFWESAWFSMKSQQELVC